MGAVDGPVDKPYNAGHYVQSNAMLKVKVELAHPLTTPTEVAAKQPLTTTPQCPFGRIVYIFNYKNTVILNQLEALVTEINAKALQLDDMPPHVISAALSTYKLSLEQQKSRDLDIMTGFQVMDGDKHVFVLEGLRDRAISYVWENVPAPENSDIKKLRVLLHHIPLARSIFQKIMYIELVISKCT
ncbi:uncharacterized protein FLJ43738-like [Crassostrea virginica]